MRAKEVKNALVSAIVEIVPDSKAHSGDVFSHSPATMDAPAVDRTFILERAQPQAPSGMLIAGADPYAIGFDLAISYLPTPDVQDRILDDGDLVVDALKNLSNSYTQILTVDLSGQSDLEDGSGSRLCTYTVSVIYDRRTI